MHDINLLPYVAVVISRPCTCVTFTLAHTIFVVVAENRAAARGMRYIAISDIFFGHITIQRCTGIVEEARR